MEEEKVTIEYLREIAQPINYNLKSGIYFLFLDDELVYIGKAACLDIRILNHISEASKQFNRYSFIPCPIEGLDAAEAEYINRFKPTHNKFIPSMPGYLSFGTLRTKFGLKQSEMRKLIKKHQPHSLNGRYQVEEIKQLLIKEGYIQQ